MASILSTHYDYTFVDSTITDNYKLPESVSAKPDGQILIFPLITLGEGTNDLAKKYLLHDQINNETLVQFLSSELHITEDTPPCFIITTVNKESRVTSEKNADIYVDQLVKSGVSVTYFKEDYGIHSTILVYPGNMASNLFEWFSTSIY